MTQLPRRATPRLRRSTVLVLGLTTLFTACVDDDDPVSQQRTGTVAVFNPSEGAIPVPSDLLFSGSLDGTFNVPVELDPNTGAPLDPLSPIISLNTVDGASTLAPILMNFSRPVDPATVVAGGSVRLFEVTTFVDPVTAPIGGPVTGITTELTPADFSVSVLTEFAGAGIQIQPLSPLTPSRINPGTGALENSVYMVVLTSAIQDVEGFAVERDATYFLAAQTAPFDPATTDADLVALQGLVGAQLLAYANAGNDPNEVVSSFTFTTQSIGAGLGSVISIANGNEAAVIAATCAALGTCGADTDPDPLSATTMSIAPLAVSIGTVPDLVGPNPLAPAYEGSADIWVASFQAPYYLTAAANTEFAAATPDPSPNFSTWSTRYVAPGEIALDPADRDNNVTRFNPLPKATGSEIMPALVSVPSTVAAGDNLPVVIFAPGVYQTRLNMLYIADVMASNGFAVVCIDLPLHGFGQTGDVGQTSGALLNGANLFVGYNQASGGPRERTFGMDQYAFDPLTGLPFPGQDTVPDPSGQNFINLLSLAVTRDNLQQAVADFSNLRTAIADLALPAPIGDVFDETNVHFVGHSLGAILGMPFVTLDNARLTASTLAMGGGAVPYLLESSVAYGPLIQASLAAAGAAAGTPEYWQFLQTGQALVDTADAMNYVAPFLATGASPIFAMEVVGGGPLGGLPDGTVPNQATANPLGGTEPFITALGLTGVSATNAGLGFPGAAVRYIEGSHSTVLAPNVGGISPQASNDAAFPEMQSNLGTYHNSGGTTITIGDPTVVQ
ncbi:MAG: hypothetical protein PVJ89_00915 [Planctomycetota bacterium]|jgi:Pla-1/cef family extracellular lipase